MGCNHAYSFTDGTRSKTIATDQHDCKTLSDWSEVVDGNTTCYRKLHFIN